MSGSAGRLRARIRAVLGLGAIGGGIGFVVGGIWGVPLNERALMSPSPRLHTPISRSTAVVLGVLFALIPLGGCVDLGEGGTFGFGVELPEDWMDYEPAWSPNGSEIAVSRSRASELGSDIHLMDTLGVAVQVTDLLFAGSPAWSPDGLRIAFASVPKIYIVRPDGSGLTEFSTNSPTYSEGLAWSPDGATIAFSTPGTSGVSQIFLLDTATSSVTSLTQPASSNSDLSWSPDGSQAVFRSDSSGRPEIHRMDADGTNIVQLTDAPGAKEPAWSPCMTQIAFSSQDVQGAQPNSLPRFAIHVMGADGSNVSVLTDQLGDDGAPSWAPDCSQIVFASNRSGTTSDIWAINVDGSGLRRVTTRD